jgi:hypothetical protein
MQRFGTWVLVAVMGIALVAGCAAQRSVKQAQLSLDNARGAGAESGAPYQFFAAQAYLELAEHEKAEMDLAAAKEFAEMSIGFSDKAIEKAGRGAQ